MSYLMELYSRIKVQDSKINELISYYESMAEWDGQREIIATEILDYMRLYDKSIGMFLMELGR